MTAASLTSYDEVPYDSKPLFATHPDCLAAAARLRGLAAAAPSNCRVLELGCAAGGNLIPMAYGLPNSRFVGIDLSPRQIADGQAVCDQLRLKNIELHAVSIADIDRSWGEFDYIICHGVYSWVPPAIQDHILKIYRSLLTPQGVAYISYNTYPGWHLKTVIRDLMKYHTARFEEPAVKVQQARSILNFLASASASLDSPLSRHFADEAKILPDAADYYLYHEHLEDANQPLYFHQFASKAQAAGLQYLGEAWHHMQIDSLPLEVRQTLEAISSDLIELEQFFDFIHSRTFRRTLVCHQEASVVQTPEASVMTPMFLEALARPESKQPEIASEKTERFTLDDGTTATTNIVVLKAALVEVYDRWPSAVPFEELLAGVGRRLHVPGDEMSKLAPVLASHLVRGYVANLVAVHCEPFSFVLPISQQPRASALARLTAAKQASVPTLRHRLATLSPVERVILPLVDGSRTVAQIAQAAHAVAAHALEREVAADEMVELTSYCLSRFSRSTLLEA